MRFLCVVLAVLVEFLALCDETELESNVMTNAELQE